MTFATQLNENCSPTSITCRRRSLFFTAKRDVHRWASISLFNFEFVSKLSTTKGLFLIWIKISELCAVPDVD